MSDTDPIWSPSLSHPAAMRAHIISAHLSDRDGAWEVDLVPDSPLSQHAPKLLEAAVKALSWMGEYLSDPDLPAEGRAWCEADRDGLRTAIALCRGEA